MWKQGVYLSELYKYLPTARYPAWRVVSMVFKGKPKYLYSVHANIKFQSKQVCQFGQIICLGRAS